MSISKPKRTREPEAARPAHEGLPCGRDADGPLAIPIAGWSDVLWRTRRELNDDNIVVVAAGVAFFSLFALVPSIAVIMSLYGLLADPSDVARHIATFTKVIPDAGGALVRGILSDVMANSRSSLSVRALVGIAVAVWSSSRCMRTLLRGLTIAYDEDPKRSWVKERARSYLFTAIAMLVAALTIATAGFLPLVLEFVGVGGAAGMVLRFSRWPALIVVSCASLAALYRYGPNRACPKWRWTIAGALLATALWMVGSGMLSLYVTYVARLNASYGSLGAFLVLMLWCYVTAFAILLGAELNSELEHQTEIDTTDDPPQPIGERGAFVADNMGPCRPAIRRLVQAKLDTAKTAAKRKMGYDD